MSEIQSFEKHIAIDADTIAKELGTARAANMVILGAAAPFLDIEFKLLQDAIKQIFERKGEEVVNMNLQALQKGYDFSLSEAMVINK